MASRTLLLISQTASPFGGVETWLDKVCAALPAHGWRPVVGAVRGVSTHRPERFLAERPGVEAVEIDGRGMPSEGRVRAVVRCIRRVAPSIVVPLVVADAHEAACRAKLAGQGIRYVAAVHGHVPCQIADLRRVAAFVDLAVCPGALTCRLVEWAGVPPERVRRVPNGVEPPRRPHVPRPPGAPIRLGYVGRMTQQDKRVLDLIPLCAALREQGTSYTLDVVGDGPARAELQHTLAASGDGARIRFHGALPHDALFDRIYPQLDCLMVFSESEAFGIAIREAMLHGVVPVSSRFLGHAAEGIVRDGETAMLFDVGDAWAAAACVQPLSADPQLWSRLSAAARARGKGGLTWEGSLERWAAALDAVLEMPCRTGNSLPDRPRCARGLLDAWRIPGPVKDGLRWGRRALFGIPRRQRNGEEWPWANQDHGEDVLREIEAARRRLDVCQPGRWSEEGT